MTPIQPMPRPLPVKARASEVASTVDPFAGSPPPDAADPPVAFVDAGSVPADDAAEVSDVPVVCEGPEAPV